MIENIIPVVFSRGSYGSGLCHLINAHDGFATTMPETGRPAIEGTYHWIDESGLVFPDHEPEQMLPDMIFKDHRIAVKAYPHHKAPYTKTKYGICIRGMNTSRQKKLYEDGIATRVELNSVPKDWLFLTYTDLVVAYRDEERFNEIYTKLVDYLDLKPVVQPYIMYRSLMKVMVL